MIRTALVLVLALVMALGLFMRTMTASVSVELIGLTHKDNPAWWSARPAQFASSSACAECHAATNEAIAASAHATVSCESCHGAAEGHIDLARGGQAAPLALADARDLCKTCHTGLASRPKDFPQVDPATHPAEAAGASASCVLCHNPHDPGFPPVIKHTLSGRADCLACHGPDQWQPVPPSHTGRAGDSCLKCHKREDSS